jgi:hypothetical protein
MTYGTLTCLHSKELVVNANVAGVMCAYNAYAGQPCCGSDELMTDISAQPMEVPRLCNF